MSQGPVFAVGQRVKVASLMHPHADVAIGYVTKRLCRGGMYDVLIPLWGSVVRRHGSLLSLSFEAP